METNKDFLAMKMLAEQGNVQAIYGVGINYLEGVYTPKDEKLGISYVEKAENLNYLPAIEYLGLCYKNGCGTVKDDKKALKNHCCFFGF